ncbi:MAG: hypothetical protein ACRD08_24590, partial [Acidimicrobiales bacterium]
DGGPGATGRLRAMVASPGRDTVRFSAPAVARACTGGTGIVLEGLASGSGVLVWLRPPPGDTALAGRYVFPLASDTTPRRRARVGVRYVFGAAAYGVTLDSGDVAARETGRALTVELHGAGLLLPGATRAFVEAGFERVPIGADSAPCEPGA